MDPRQEDAILCEAAESGDIETIRTALKQGLNPNGYSGGPLYIAVEKGNLDVVKCLYEHGAHPSLKAVYAACQYGHTDILCYFLRLRVNRRVLIPVDVKMYSIAGRYGHLDVCLLLEAFDPYPVYPIELYRELVRIGYWTARFTDYEENSTDLIATERKFMRSMYAGLLGADGDLAYRIMNDYVHNTVVPTLVGLAD